MKRCLPYEATVVLELHLEKRILETGEVVVVDAGVDEGRRDADLPHVILDGELGLPHGQGPPVFAKGGVVWHARIDVVYDASLLRSVSTRSANGNLIAPVRCVDECDLDASEQSSQ